MHLRCGKHCVQLAVRHPSEFKVLFGGVVLYTLCDRPIFGRLTPQEFANGHDQKTCIQKTLVGRSIIVCSFIQKLLPLNETFNQYTKVRLKSMKKCNCCSVI